MEIHVYEFLNVVDEYALDVFPYDEQVFTISLHVGDISLKSLAHLHNKRSFHLIHFIPHNQFIVVLYCSVGHNVVPLQGLLIDEPHIGPVVQLALFRNVRGLLT